MKKLFGIILCLCMLLGLMSVTAFAAATDISVTSAAYHDNGDVKTIGIRFGWSSASATSRLAVMTSRLRSAGEAGTHGTYGDFTDDFDINVKAGTGLTVDASLLASVEGHAGL